MKSIFKSFRKNQIHELNKIKGGGITYKTNGHDGTYRRTDAWFLLKENNYTDSDSHTDVIC